MSGKWTNILVCTYGAKYLKEITGKYLALVTTYNTVLEFNDLAFMHICVI